MRSKQTSNNNFLKKYLKYITDDKQLYITDEITPYGKRNKLMTNERNTPVALRVIVPLELRDKVL